MKTSSNSRPFSCFSKQQTRVPLFAEASKKGDDETPFISRALDVNFTDLEQSFLNNELNALTERMRPLHMMARNLMGVAGALGIGSMLGETALKMLIQHGLLKEPFNHKKVLFDMAMDIVIGALVGGSLGVLRERSQLKQLIQQTQNQLQAATNQTIAYITSVSDD